MAKKVTLSVIIPVYNEEKTVKQLIKSVLAEKTPKEVIVVDDGSKDQTRQILAKISSQKTKVRVILHEKNKGKGAAVRTGINAAKGEALIIQDADLEYDPIYYQKLLNQISSKQAKVVYGSRLKELKFKVVGKDRTLLPLHYVMNRFLSSLTNVLYGCRLTDMETCYKMLTKEVYQQLELVSDRFDIEPEITAKILKKGYQIAEVPITTKPRDYKQGKKIKAKDAFYAIRTLFKYRFKKIA